MLFGLSEACATFQGMMGNVINEDSTLNDIVTWEEHLVHIRNTLD